MKYPCTGCGACCRKVNLAVMQIEKMLTFFPKFPYKWDKNGVCEMLDLKNNKCKVYDNRPLICNVEAFAEYLKVDKKEFYEENIKACNSLIISEGLNENYLIK